MKSRDGVDPEDFRPLPEAIRTAKSLSEDFVRTWREALYETETANELVDFISVEGPNGVRTSVPLFDIQKHVLGVAVHCRYFLLRMGKFPCIELKSGDMPICSLNEFFGSEKDAQDYKTVEKSASPGMARKMLKNFRDKFLSRDDHPMMVSPTKGEVFLRDGLKSFLSTRLGAYRRLSPEPIREVAPPSNNRKNAAQLPVVAPGIFSNEAISVEVECKAKGRRIHSSPAFFVDWTYFGQPSPKVMGWLPPGRYVFATDGKNQDYLPDPAVFSIPTEFNPVLKRF